MRQPGCCARAMSPAIAFDPRNQPGAPWACPSCRRQWVHDCDEAEGCSWRPLMSRVDELLAGAEFFDQQGLAGTFVRQHGANRGAYIVVLDGGHETTYAGCAEVHVRSKEVPHG